MAVLFAGFAALLFGSSDFVGGYATRRNAALLVVFLSQLSGLAAAAVAALVLGDPMARGEDLFFGALAGLGGVLGLTLLYRGLATSVVAVVSPLAAVTGAVFPVLFGLAAGERPALLAWLGIALALPAIVLLVWEPEEAEHHEDGEELVRGQIGPGMAPPHGAGKAAERRAVVLRGAVLGVAAGIGFGLSVIAISRVSAEATLWPVAAARVAGMAALAPLLLLRRQGLRPARGSVGIIILAGVLDMLGNIAFLEASRGTLLAIAAVVTSLYPAPTVLLGAVVFRERITRLRAAGLVLALGGIALISLPG